MASMAVDPMQALQAALQAPQNSKEQADILSTLRQSLELHPAPIRILVGTLITSVVNAGDSLLKRWVIDLLYFGICRSTLPVEQKTQMSSLTLDTLVQLVDDPNPVIVKVVVQILTSVYPLLFKSLCANRNNPAAWNTLSNVKSRIIDFVWAPNTPMGLRLASVKFLQKTILVQTRGNSDPRLQNRNDPNISLCPADHPFISVAKLESEGQKLLEGVITTLYSSKNPDLLSALVNSWATLTKLRPALLPVVITALTGWTPNALVGLPASSIKSVEKSVRILLNHLYRLPANAPFIPQITEALNQQGLRMQKAAEDEKRRKAPAKRPASEENTNDAKRPKLEDGGAAGAGASLLASFDFTSLPATLITDLIVANIEAFSEEALTALVQAYRQTQGLVPPPRTQPPPKAPTPTPTPTPPTLSAPKPLTPQATSPETVANLEKESDKEVKNEPVEEEEPMDPLQMDIDQDEMEYEPDRLNEELAPEQLVMETETVAPLLSLSEFKFPPPKDLPEDDRTALIGSTISRIWTDGEEMARDSVGAAGGEHATELWMLLLVRMITRVAEPPKEEEDSEGREEGKAEEELAGKMDDFYERQDQLRQTLCEYIMADFPSRVSLATTWMNEEWYNDRIRLAQDRDWRPNYDTWLNQIVVSYQALLDGKDRTFSRFLLDLPSVPPDVLALLRDLCVDQESPERMQVGFTTLRGFVVQRPSMRAEALHLLLELTTHSERKVRGAAINTVKLWVPNSQPMDGMIREFALGLLRRLQSAEKPKEMNGDVVMVNGEAGPEEEPKLNGEKDVVMGEVEEKQPPIPDEESPLHQDELIQTPYLPPKIELPAQQSQVLQHVEVIFALCVKVPEFLDEIFDAYGQMDVSVQESIQVLITALIRSLGSSHGKLLTLMRTCPAGSESLSLRVLSIFTENGRPSAQLVALVKALINERDLDARFLIPIIAEMDKADIMRYLPRIVSILNGQSEPKNLVRSVFSSIVTTPPQTFGSVTSNLPRVRQSELLTPTELMVLLHNSEKEIGLKSAMEAIGICFSMTDVFRSEILAVVMQQIMDEPELPVLFLRTVIQAVTTYKSLVGFVSTTLLSRLITKKIWTNPPLWGGFIRCAKVIAPASFGALLQLPKDQLRELVDKQPTLKSGLREYVTKKATNKARVAGLLDILGETEVEGTGAVNTPPPQTPPPEPPVVESVS